MPSPLFSTGSPPVTTLISNRPFDTRSSVAAMRAATLGDCRPGRTATRKRSRSVHGATPRRRPRSPRSSPGRQQHAVIAELVGGLRDLAQVIEVDVAAAVVVPR